MPQSPPPAPAALQSGPHAAVARQHGHLDKLRCRMARSAVGDRKARNHLAAQRLNASDQALAGGPSAALGLAQAFSEDAGGQKTLHAGVVGLHLVAALLDG